MCAPWVVAILHGCCFQGRACLLSKDVLLQGIRLGISALGPEVDAVVLEPVDADGGLDAIHV
jgi:hypothetical protein